MSNVSEICGRSKTVGGSITRRGMAKKQGGIGTHVVKNTKRVFKPNLQRIRVRTPGGVRRMRVCTACIRADKVQKA